MVAGGAGRLLLRDESCAADLRYARAYSGLSVLDFVKRVTVQEVSAEGFARNLGPTAVTLAELEDWMGTPIP